MSRLAEVEGYDPSKLLTENQATLPILSTPPLAWAMGIEPTMPFGSALKGRWLYQFADTHIIKSFSIEILDDVFFSLKQLYLHKSSQNQKMILPSLLALYETTSPMAARLGFEPRTTALTVRSATTTEPSNLKSHPIIECARETPIPLGLEGIAHLPFRLVVEMKSHWGGNPPRGMTPCGVSHQSPYGFRCWVPIGGLQRVSMVRTLSLPRRTV